MLYCKSSGRRLLQHELARVTCDSRDSHNMRLRETCATRVKFDEILPLQIAITVTTAWLHPGAYFIPWQVHTLETHYNKERSSENCHLSCRNYSILRLYTNHLSLGNIRAANHKVENSTKL